MRGRLRLVVVEVPPAGAVPLARAVSAAGLTEHVRALAGDRGAALLPTALDASAIAFARDIGLAVHPNPTIEAAEVVLKATMLLNTKTGFRETAEQLGMRLPTGQACRRSEVGGVARELLREHERVVVKPDRSAGGHGLRFVSRDDLKGGGTLALGTVGGPQGFWVVEACLAVAESVSIQLEVTTSGTRALFSGAMRTAQGSFTGYVSPLPPSCSHVADVLEEWGDFSGSLSGRPGLRRAVRTRRARGRGRGRVREREQHPSYGHHHSAHHGHSACCGISQRAPGMVAVERLDTSTFGLRGSSCPVA